MLFHILKNMRGFLFWDTSVREAFGPDNRVEIWVTQQGCVAKIERISHQNTNKHTHTNYLVNILL